MSVDFKKTSHVLFFAAFLPALSVGLGWLCARLISNAPFWVETLSPLTAYGLLYSFFDRAAWHWPLFRWLGIVTCPDVRGRWLGEQVSSFRDETGTHRTSRVILEIKQTFSGLQAQIYYFKWRSANTIAQFIDVQGTPTLFIMFDAEPKADYDGPSTTHKGVSKLIQRPDKTLAGTYFNATGRHGELSFKRTMYALHGAFESPKNNQ